MEKLDLKKLLKVDLKNFLKDWNWWKFIKGRKRMSLTVVAGVLGYWITNNELVGILAGAVVESAFGICEFYYLKR